jgi:hypothetical protein
MLVFTATGYRAGDYLAVAAVDSFLAGFADQPVWQSAENPCPRVCGT